MISVLQQCLCVLRNVLLALAFAGVELVNLLVLAVGALGAGLIIVLPNMPEAPPSPSGGVLGLLNWVVPMAPLLSGFATLITVWLVFMGVRVGLNWVKAL